MENNFLDLSLSLADLLLQLLDCSNIFLLHYQRHLCFKLATPTFEGLEIGCPRLIYSERNSWFLWPWPHREMWYHVCARPYKWRYRFDLAEFGVVLCQYSILGCHWSHGVKIYFILGGHLYSHKGSNSVYLTLSRTSSTNLTSRRYPACYWLQIQVFHHLV